MLAPGLFVAHWSHLAEIEAVITCTGPRPRSAASQSGDWTVRNSTSGNCI